LLLEDAMTHRVGIFILIITCGTTFSMAKVPRWMVQLPEEPAVIYAVGYSYPYTVMDTTRYYAVNTGLVELCRFFSLHVQTETVTWTHPEDENQSDRFINYAETVDTALCNSLRENILIVDQYTEPSTKILYVLLRYRLENSQYPAADVTILTGVGGENSDTADQDGKPEWITKTPRSADALYAVGYEERYSDPTTARTKSIEKARCELAKSVSLKIDRLLDQWAGLDKKVNEHYTQSITRIAAKTSLLGSQIVGFWYDQKTEVSYALARVTRKSLLQSVHMAIRTSVKDSNSTNNPQVESGGTERDSILSTINLFH
jgi:hypothetical protein